MTNDTPAASLSTAALLREMAALLHRAGGPERGAKRHQELADEALKRANEVTK